MPRSSGPASGRRRGERCTGRRCGGTSCWRRWRTTRASSGPSGRWPARVVMVRVGWVEQQGPHCPMDVDISHTQALAVETAGAIADFPVIVAPPVWIGLTHYNMGEVGTITASVETYIALVSEI